MGSEREHQGFLAIHVIEKSVHPHDVPKDATRLALHVMRICYGILTLVILALLGVLVFGVLAP